MTRPCRYFFFFNDTATTEIYTLSLHDALPIYVLAAQYPDVFSAGSAFSGVPAGCFATTDGSLWNGTCSSGNRIMRSEEHTSELQSRQYLVCRLLLEKKKNRRYQCAVRQEFHPP